MGMFDDLLGKAAGGAGGSGGLVAAVLELLVNRQGGISGLAEAFRQKGMGHLVSSWIGTGANLPVSPDQIQHVLGNEQIQAVADNPAFRPKRPNHSWPSCCRALWTGSPRVVRCPKAAT